MAASGKKDTAVAAEAIFCTKTRLERGTKALVKKGINAVNEAEHTRVLAVTLAETE